MAEETRTARLIYLGEKTEDLGWVVYAGPYETAVLDWIKRSVQTVNRRWQRNGTSEFKGKHWLLILTQEQFEALHDVCAQYFDEVLTEGFDEKSNDTGEDGDHREVGEENPRISS